MYNMRLDTMNEELAAFNYWHQFATRWRRTSLGMIVVLVTVTLFFGLSWKCGFLMTTVILAIRGTDRGLLAIGSVALYVVAFPQGVRAKSLDSVAS